MLPVAWRDERERHAVYARIQRNQCFEVGVRYRPGLRLICMPILRMGVHYDLPVKLRIDGPCSASDQHETLQETLH